MNKENEAASARARGVRLQDQCASPDGPGTSEAYEERCGLERRIELHRIAENIAAMLIGRVSRRERCILRQMVETLLDGER